MSEFNKYRLKGAYHYDWYETEDWYRYLIDRAVKFCRGSTLDVGCGDGVLANKIAEKGRRAVGIDKSQAAVSIAREHGNAFFQDHDINWRLDGVWEYMASINAIEHFEQPEKVKELLKNNITKGAIITTIDYQGGALGEDHKFEWTYDEMMDFFKEFKPKGFRYKDTEWIGVEIKL